MRDMRLCQFALIFAGAVVVAATPNPVSGQGFGLNDIGSCAVGRAYAATGSPCRDASVIYWNPGATTTLSGWSIYAGAAAIGVNGGFTADTTLVHYPGTVPVSFPPHVFANYTGHIGNRAASIGFGAYVPYGLTSEWNSDFPGRFEAQKATLQTFYFQPNIAIEIVPHKLSVGAGPIFGHSSVELIQALDLSQAPTGASGIPFGLLGIPLNTEFGQAKLSGDATAWGWAVGVFYRPISTLQIGARFLSALTFNYSSATATFKQVPTGLTLAANNPLNAPAGTPVDGLLATQFTSGALVTQTASTKITHPLQAEGGIGFTGITRLLLDLDYDVVGYDSFKVLPIAFSGPAAAAGLNRTLIEDYGNSWAIRLGAEYALGDSINGVTLRGGFSYTSTPAPPGTVTPLLPDMNRYNGAFGVGVPFSREVSLDAAYLHVFTEGRRGRVVEVTTPGINSAQPAFLPTAFNSGFYNLAADVFSLSLRFHL